LIQPTQSSRRILLPVKPWFIFVSLLAALFLNVVPLGRFAAMPDWVALVLLFWCIHQPSKVGMWTAFVFGLLMDVADASVMGQHTLAYVILAFGAGGLSRRILWFPLLQQALHVLPILLGTQVIMLLIRLAVGGDFPGFVWFLGSFIGAALWYPLTYLLLLPQFRPMEHDETRPI
jgi:rod shape-determining protein MreD